MENRHRVGYVLLPDKSGGISFASIGENIHIAVDSTIPGESGDAELILNKQASQLLSKYLTLNLTKCLSGGINFIGAIDAFDPTHDLEGTIVVQVVDKTIQLIVAQRNPGEVMMDAVSIIIDEFGLKKVLELLDCAIDYIEIIDEKTRNIK